MAACPCLAWRAVAPSRSSAEADGLEEFKANAIRDVEGKSSSTVTSRLDSEEELYSFYESAYLNDEGKQESGLAVYYLAART
jgi:hypothetical protein